jgi:hypothetical protein
MCPDGFWDANRNPSDGCEYECIPTSPATELCDGYDNDCDPTTPDGDEDPGIGTACDGLDDDPCEEGALRCDGGRAVCEDYTDNSRESCNGVDDDCDATIDEDATDDQPYYEDRDADGWGDGASTMNACGVVAGYVGRLGDCNDLEMSVNPDATEGCNGQDDDCDSIIDESADCGCVVETWGGHVYSFCSALVNWGEADDACADRGAELATIEDAAENAWLTERARFHRRAPAWMGLNDEDREGTWVWDAGGDLGSYRPWQSGEPNDGGECWGCEENCGALGFFAGADTWNDFGCYEDLAYVCERTP